MTPLRILIVEDEPLIAMDLEDILEGAGHVVLGTASSTRQALRLAADAERFDLAILDIDLAANDDGIETARRLRSEYGIDALFVTARLEEEARARNLEWKPIGFIGKPYLPNQVLAAIDRIATS